MKKQYVSFREVRPVQTGLVSTQLSMAGSGLVKLLTRTT